VWQPAVGQQCEHNLASSYIAVLFGGSAAGSVPHWSPAHVCWYGSDKCHLILETEIDCLQLVGSYCGEFCMCTSITGFKWSVFFLCACMAFCVVADAVECSITWNACVSEIESESVVCYWFCFVRTEQRVCIWQHSSQHWNNLALCCLKTMVDSYFWLMWQCDATGKKSLYSWTNRGLTPDIQ